MSPPPRDGERARRPTPTRRRSCAPHRAARPHHPDSPTQVADALGRTSTYAYHATLGITTLATDPRGHETEFTYGTLSGLAVLDSVTERNVATWAEPSSSDDTTDATRRLTTKFVYEADV